MLKSYSRRAEIDKEITPHTLRNSFATEFIRQGKSVMTLKKILGHSDIGTTQLYVALANKDIEEAINGYKIRQYNLRIKNILHNNLSYNKDSVI